MDMNAIATKLEEAARVITAKRRRQTDASQPPALLTYPARPDEMAIQVSC